MVSDKIVLTDDGLIEQNIRNELVSNFESEKQRIFKKFAMAALGSIPWVGGFLSATINIIDERKQIRVTELHEQWLEEHSQRMRELSQTLVDIMQRLKNFGEETDKRIESKAYLTLVRRGFRSWDQADTNEKRQLIKKLLSNAGVVSLCPDDLIRLFIDWIDLYHEAHFAVIKEIYQHPGITRAEIWRNIHGEIQRENSAEADLFRLLIHDLSTGRVIRQHRPTNAAGQFIAKSRSKSKRSSPGVMKSAFDDEEPYELTELGKHFVHYTMDEIVPRIGNNKS